MPTLSAAANVALRMDQLYMLDLYDGTITETSPSRATVVNGTRRAEFTGSLQYLDGQISDGTITGITVYVNNAQTFSLTNMAFDAADFAQYAVYDQRTEAEAAIFAGADTITGSNLADTIYGYGGADVLHGGIGADQLYGGDGDDVLDGGAGVDTMYGGAGNDTYYIDNPYDEVHDSGGVDTIYSSVDVWSDFTYYGVVFGYDNVILTGDAIRAEGTRLQANVLTGNDKNNILDGLSGADTMIGGLGDDSYYVDDPGDVVVENANAGVDTVHVRAGSDKPVYSFTLGAEFENLTIENSSYRFDTATGNDRDNVIVVATKTTVYGLGGDDTLEGKTGKVQTLYGGAGDDTYIINTNDIVRETLAADGVDTVICSGTYKLTSNVENLILSGTGAFNGNGTALANVMTGNTAANTLSGGAGDDTLNGGGGADTLLGGEGDDVLDGGAGVDTMSGGSGDDTYVVDSLSDVINETSAADGTDTVSSAISYLLTASFVENVTLSGTADINAGGNSLANILTGNSGANILNGGTGADTMMGGAGNDTYVVDDAGDKVRELSAADGIDLVQSSVSYKLTSNVENLTLTGTAAINGNGTSLANSLTGNSAANTLSGGAGNDILDGGAGADTLLGGADNDTYVVDNAGDIVKELLATDGVDTVLSSISYKLTANVENLTLTGTGGLSANGTSLDNILIGNSGANRLSGGGGADTLTGGAGADVFIYKTVADSSVATFDRITDLTGSDTIDLSAVDANTTVAGDQSFTIVSAFTNAAGQMTLAYSASTMLTTILMDVDGDGAADMKIVVNGDQHAFTNFVF